MAVTLAHHNIPLATMDHLSPLFRDIFPDSKIAMGFAAARTKTSCIVNMALRPHFEESVVSHMRGNLFNWQSMDQTTMVLTRWTLWQSESLILTKVVSQPDFWICASHLAPVQQRQQASLRPWMVLYSLGRFLGVTAWVYRLTTHQWTWENTTAYGRELPRRINQSTWWAAPVISSTTLLERLQMLSEMYVCMQSITTAWVNCLYK